MNIVGSFERNLAEFATVAVLFGHMFSVAGALGAMLIAMIRNTPPYSMWRVLVVYCLALLIPPFICIVLAASVRNHLS